ncbi:MAG: hypothetical protein QUV35_12825 [Hydrogenophaga sp.]|uniref:hypothetical protein n=1 Tax=Hydrogenophaga sp. TaxID=1904254 RepID=UPI002612FD66|nr:hypothetical protein [Hydrogenophaga sp.]MDM7943502.1 hypothetical protein [Hydrogenophaga sp.]
MKRLHTELSRLYLSPPADGQDAVDESRLVDADGQTRALVLGLARPADWDAISRVWQGVQADLELPAPAIAVCGADGYQLWFSLAQPVPPVQAHAFLELLRLRYLDTLAPARISFAPGPAGHTRLVPARHADSGQWSAFVSADLAAVFADDPSLDLPPGEDNQADLLSRLKSIQSADFETALQRLRPVAPAATAAVPAGQAAHAPQDPESFLRGVMNDSSVPLALRIEAAKALLPGPRPHQG